MIGCSVFSILRTEMPGISLDEVEVTARFLDFGILFSYPPPRCSGLYQMVRICRVFPFFTPLDRRKRGHTLESQVGANQKENSRI